jgi:hypothetical protein
VLHKLIDGWTAPVLGQTYSGDFVMPIAGQAFRTATFARNSATQRSKSRGISRWPRSLTHFILVSARRRR